MYALIVASVLIGVASFAFSLRPLIVQDLQAFSNFMRKEIPALEKGTPPEENQKTKSDPSADPIAAALGLIQSLIGLFTLVTGFFAIASAVIAWWLQKIYEDLTSKYKQLEIMLETQYDNMMSVVDLVWSHIPEITYTQQIPFTVVRSLGGVQTFLELADQTHFWTKNEHRQRMQPRIFFALAVRKFAMNPNDAVAVIGHSGVLRGRQDNRNSVISLLLHAEGTENLDGDQLRNISMRLAQSYRQHFAFSEARNVLNRFTNNSKLRSDSVGKALAQWASAVVDLQEGFSSNDHGDRVELFRRSEKKMQIAYTEIFEAFPRKIRSADEENYANIAYYRAKTMWSYLFAARETAAKETFDDAGPFMSRFRAALTRSLEMLETNMTKTSSFANTDPTIAAIYNSCVSHILVVEKAMGWLAHDEFAAKTRFDECTSEATLAINNLSQQVRSDGIQRFIYSEMRERLTSLGDLKDEIDSLRKWWYNTGLLYDFYSGSGEHAK